MRLLDVFCRNCQRALTIEVREGPPEPTMTRISGPLRLIGVMPGTFLLDLVPPIDPPRVRGDLIVTRPPRH